MTLRSLLALAGIALALQARAEVSIPPALVLNDHGYLAMPGLNVMLAQDFYPEGHQGGVGIIQNGQRVATNGDLRLSPTPGQWQPTPAVGAHQVIRATQEISVHLSYPNPQLDRKGFNPIAYPDLKLGYVVRVQPAGAGFRIFVDLDQPLPPAWAGKVGFNLELFPGILFGKSFEIGHTVGLFPRQAEGPGSAGTDVSALGQGRTLTIAPESERQRMTIEAVHGGELQLLDGRAQHNNGWFVVRALVPAKATQGAIEWLVQPHAIPGWKSAPVIQVSQIGYHPKQPKLAVIELDGAETDLKPVTLYQVTSAGLREVRRGPARDWGRFLRYRYLQYDFSDVVQPGLYEIGYDGRRSAAFPISADVFERDVWQPTVEYFLPVQMCHVRVNENYRVWHGLCHADDALMAPPNENHFDGYAQGPSTLTRFKGGDHVPGLDRGGWHDAGDFDLRIESQADTVHGLALAWELFHPTLDDTSVDEQARIVDIHRPDGKPDVLQQIEHGVLSIVGGYHALGRLYRGIQDPSLAQYTHLGDPSTATDNQVFHDSTGGEAMKILADAAREGSQAEPQIDHLPRLGSAGSADDRWVFTERNAAHEFTTASALAAASRVLRGFDDPMAADCLKIARELWTSANYEAVDRSSGASVPVLRLEAAIELYQTTHDSTYADAITSSADYVVEHPDRAGWLGARALGLITDASYREKIRAALRIYRAQVDALGKETPYGVPYRPQIWGAAWGIERFGVQQYFLHAGAPDIFPATYLLRAIDFVLGCHPGPNNASFVSGVGARSMTTAYGFNRADASYIPGGIVSGTALIRPDFPELLDWPYLWQQGEYCLGYPTSDYIFLVLAADHVLNR
ncbi:MAG TPA: glycoside hydrolase family 9 protein [Opitutaceae bacterium]|nr:glycoside hydrolase family 9 protein [Opitutaceae bacterium]